MPDENAIPNGNQAPDKSNSPSAGNRLAKLLRNPWVVFIGPFIVFMLLTSLEPTPDKPGGEGIGLSIPYAYYPWVYTVKVVLTTLSVLLVAPAYRQFPFKVSGWAVLTGVVGIVAWIGICKLEIERGVLARLNELVGSLGMGDLIELGARSAYNPFEQIDSTAGAWTFLAVRFFGLALLVPVIEEFFLRGFLMRYFMQHDWWKSPIGSVNATAVVIGTVFPMLMHPAELLAAAVWFSMVTVLMIRTRNIWDCVVAHAITNLLLGLYVVYSGDWYFM
ncbi:MAG: CAAX prenyl protease-related protein [Pirellulales bacterium]|nr:CAAX prenyl protease-related protein [Pirellulales bacterium]